MRKITCVLFVVMTAAGILSPLEKYIRIFLPDGETVAAEVAESEKQRMQGLMYRDGINEDQGMLFIFEEEGYHSFWMKNMKFAIDILWLDRQKRIVHTEKEVPPCKKEPCPSYSPALPAMYVLELKAGSVDKRKLKLYDRLEFILDEGH